MPELDLCLNDKKFFETSGKTTSRKVVDIEDIKFHQCVRLGVFENDRTISFIPPDGEFDLVNYRMPSANKPLLTCFIKYEVHTDTKLVFSVQAKSLYRDKIMANFVEFYIPVPPESQNVKSKSSSGLVKYQPDTNCLCWKLKQLYGKKEVTLKCQLNTPIIQSKERDIFKKKPVNVKFEIPYYTLSGISVRYLKISTCIGFII